MANYLDDYQRLEDTLLSGLTAIAEAIRDELKSQELALDDALVRALVTSLLWSIATVVNGRIVGQSTDGRDILATLGFVVRGSES